MSNKPLSINLSTEVPASADAVWEAITTGPGLANWFPQFSEAEPGIGGRVRLSWGPECEWDTFITAWKDGEMLRWEDDPETTADNPMAVEFHLTDNGSSTTVRLVQSGFSEGDEFSEGYQGVKAGWTYFLYNLQHYFAWHQGKARELLNVSERFAGPRADIWRRILAAGGGLVVTSPAEMAIGQGIDLLLGSDQVVQGIVEVLIAERAIGIRLPKANQSLLFIEIEPGAADTTTGFWLSSYGESFPAAVGDYLKSVVSKLAKG